MKKAILNVLLIFLIGIYGCNQKSKTDCYVIEVEQLSTVTPEIEGYPKTEYSVINKCDISDKEAEYIAKQGESDISQDLETHIIRVITTCKFYLKSEYIGPPHNKGTMEIKKNYTVK